MFNNYRSTYGDEKIACKTIWSPFCNLNNVEEDIGCWILVGNYVKRCA
jgi:hypothetical protein